MGFYDEIPILQHFDTLKRIESGQGSLCAPIHARLEPTELCNFRCDFCCWYNGDRHKTIPSARFTGKNIFRRQRLLKLIEELIQCGTMAFSFSGGGDPLLYPWMAVLLKVISERKKPFGITSNMAMNISDDLIGELAKADWIRWSMNAGTYDTYLKIHNPIGSNGHNIFERALHNIRLVNDIRLRSNLRSNINASYVVSDTNSHDISNAIKLTKDLGVACISFRKDTPVVKQDSANQYSEKEEQDILTGKEQFETDRFKVYINYDRLEDTQKANDPELFCFYSNHSVYIAADGSVYPCCYARLDAKYAIGNVNHSDFMEIWNSKKRRENYKHLIFDQCPTCAYGQTIKALKPLYEGKIKAKDIFVKTVHPNYFI
ncbi:MAG: radical SAM protein [Deltaproteobacteria bacterium]|nr:radical SAM protein [Deltaproteobacteria bacterium]